MELQAKEASTVPVSVYKLAAPKFNVKFNLNGEVSEAALVQYAFTPKVERDNECNDEGEPITFRAWNQRRLLGVRSSLKSWTSYDVPVPKYAAIVFDPSQPRSGLLVEWPDGQHWVSGESPFGYRVVGRLGTQISGVWTVAPTCDEVCGYTAPIPNPVEEKEEVVEEEEEDTAIVAYNSDPFMITADGHYVDMSEADKKPEEDWFVVPKNFAEFYDKNPKYVLNWVKKRLGKYEVDADVEDWAQDLLMHLKYLPENSKHRRNGKEDVIETFNPWRAFGCNEARFRNFINKALSNKLMTGQMKHGKNPICRVDTISLSGDENTDHEGMEPGMSTPEYVYANSEYLNNKTMQSQKNDDDRLFTAQFIAYVERVEPEILPAIEALMSTQTQSQAARYLNERFGIKLQDNDFTKFRNRLKVLAACFIKGVSAPIQRGKKIGLTLVVNNSATTPQNKPEPGIQKQSEPSISEPKETMTTTDVVTDNDFITVVLDGVFGAHSTLNPNDPSRYMVNVLAPFTAADVLRYGVCPWANPRIGFQSTKGVKTSAVSKDIRESAKTKPLSFFDRNGGVVVVADSAIVTDDGKMSIRFAKDKMRGLADGGTTVQTIFDGREKGEIGDTGYFKLEVRCGNFTTDEVAAIAQGLNTRKQVDEVSLANQRGDFDWIRDILEKGKEGFPAVPKVEYYLGDTGELTLTEVLKVFCAFTMSSPVEAYNGNQKCLDFHASDDGKATLQKHGDLLVDMLYLSEYIPAKFTTMPDLHKKLSAPGLKLLSKKKKGVTLPMTGATTDLELNNAVILPILSALRHAIDPKTMSWKVRPEVIIEKCGEELMANILDTYKNDWNHVGKDANLYKVLGLTVKAFIAEQM